jgi:cyanuric acid amidohydrolase
MQAFVHRVPANGPGDASGLLALIDSGAVAAEDIVAVLGKTEGNGCVNDFTRSYATLALSLALSERLGMSHADVTSRVSFVMSGGTEGGLSPHFIVFGRRAGTPPAAGAGKRLAIGTAKTRVFAPHELGRMAQLTATADAVSQAIADAGLTELDDVHYVQVKCPLLTSERVQAAQAVGRPAVTEDTYVSMGLSRGASALGVALALQEVSADALSDAAIADDLTLWSNRASTSAGIELMHNEVVVLGNAESWSGDLVIASAVMQDAIDLPAVVHALRAAGLEPGAGGQLTPPDRDRVMAVLAKAEASRSGQIRGARHIMWDDSDINATRHARAMVGGVIAGVVGQTALFVSGGAEHQGPDGGGPVAVIART